MTETVAGMFLGPSFGIAWDLGLNSQGTHGSTFEPALLLTAGEQAHRGDHLVSKIKIRK